MTDYPFSYKINILKEKLPAGNAVIGFCDNGMLIASSRIDPEVFLPKIHLTMMRYSGMEFRGIFTNAIRTERELTEYEIDSLEMIIFNDFHIPIKLSRN